MADVLEVEGELAAHVVLIAVVREVHLGPPGDPGPDPLAALVPLDALTQVHEDLGLLGSWPHDVHVALQDVPELRELVEPQPPQHPADRRHAIVVGAWPCPELWQGPCARVAPAVASQCGAPRATPPRGWPLRARRYVAPRRRV